MTDIQQDLTPSEIEPGQFKLVFGHQFDADEQPFFYEIQFNWDGDTSASFSYDVWDNPTEPTFVAEVSSSPVLGWASWVNGKDVLIAFSQPMAEEEGWARVDYGAPAGTADDPDEALDEPGTWISFAKLIHAVVMDEPVPNMTRQTY